MSAALLDDVDKRPERFAIIFLSEFETYNNHPYGITKDGPRFLIPIIVNPTPLVEIMDWRAMLAR